MTDEWIWDKWQQELIDHEGSVTVRCGRQVGKSTTAGKRRANQMLKYKDSVSLIIGPAVRQSGELFIKVMGWLEHENQKQLEKAGGYTENPDLTAKGNMDLKRRFEYDHGIYNEIPTKTTVILKKDFNKPRGFDNKGSVCYALPAGKTGIYLRTYALDFLDIDEAAYVPEMVYTALKPMLAVSEKKRGLGWETFLSTPFGKGGFFFESHYGKDYKKFHVSTEDCPRISKGFLKKERARLTKALYRQEWQGEFCDEWNQFFPTALIKKCMTMIDWNKKDDGIAGANYYLGQDLARYGGDEVAYVIAEEHDNKVKAVKCLTRERVSTTHTVGETGVIDDEWNFKRIFTDSGGMGGPVLDQLQDKVGKRKVIGLDNSTKGIQVEGDEKRVKILKEDLYSFTLMLMETGRLDLINDLDLLKSMKSITFEYTADKKVKIFGKYSHLTEALVRACWCLKEKGLDIYCY